MTEFSEILSRKDLLCAQCVKTLEKLEGGSLARNREKERVAALLLFMAGIYLYWIAGLIALVHLF